jgi:DNA helicase-2/ATP-dependent DNA helicase PcrA
VAEIIVAAAGSGKTTYIVRDALKHPDENSIVVTYTQNNLEEVKKKFYEEYGCIPANIEIRTWYSFLLQELARPYQNEVHQERIESFAFVEGRSPSRIRKSNVSAYFFVQEKYIYSDKISEFCCLCNERSGGLVMDRIGALYDRIYIDEVQDLAGYDLELLEVLLSAKPGLTLVGDHRQATYATNHSAKNKAYAGAKIIEKFAEWEKRGLCSVEYSSESHRCIQSICDLANLIYPQYPKLASRNIATTDHDGVFSIPRAHVAAYIAKYQPQVLRYSKTSRCDELSPINFGEAKGLTFERVLIFCNGPLKKLLTTADFKHVEKSAAKLYVAITRARQSVAFVHESVCALDDVATLRFRTSEIEIFRGAKPKQSELFAEV